MNYVIGSGPAGIAAVMGLLDKGQEVTVIDPGAVLEESKAALRDRLGAVEPIQWKDSDLRTLKEGMQPDTKGIPQKRIYGSSYLYNDWNETTPMRVFNAKVLRSAAAGGLSNVWGACLLPYPEEEFKTWPFSIEALAPHYRSVLDFVPHAGREDALSQFLPLYGDSYSELKPSRQADTLINRLDRNRKKLAENGIHFGLSRLAVEHSPECNGRKHCRYCALCLYGCPYSLIYSSAFTLKKLVEEGRVRHIAGYAVNRLAEKNGSVHVYAASSADGANEVFVADRVFLAAGVVETARIMLNSLELYDKPLKCSHSDRFTLPFFCLRGQEGVFTEKMHTLSQFFLELNDRSISEESVHLQAYTYNDLYLKALNNKFGRARKIMSFPIRQALERLTVFFGYLHSNRSSTLSFTLKKNPVKELVVEGHASAESSRIASRVGRKIASCWKIFGGLPAFPSLDLPGGGNHSGGTFPMSNSPGTFESDLLGRPTSFAKVHIVDSSVFPSLSASTIVFTIMANAHRIASNSKE